MYHCSKLEYIHRYELAQSTLEVDAQVCETVLDVPLHQLKVVHKAVGTSSSGSDDQQEEVQHNRGDKSMANPCLHFSVGTARE